MDNKTYNIEITNGVGTQNLFNGDYNVSSNIAAYDNTTILPQSISIVDGTNEYSFTVAAAGTLTLHVSENQTSTGKAVVGAKFIRTNADGTVTYGSEITSDENGNAVFEHVPFDASNAPIIYFKQTSSDGSHVFADTVQNTSLTEQTKTLEILNSIPDLRTINLSDQYYNGLPLTGTLTLEGNN